MGEGNGDWLRVRGLGRERFVSYLSDYLASLGYVVDAEASTSATESRVKVHLGRMNPAVPSSASQLSFRAYPTSGGAALVWETPTEIKEADRGRMDRLVRELTSHLERAILTESHATAKVVRPSTSQLPWERRAEPAAAPALSDDGSADTGSAADL